MRLKFLISAWIFLALNGCAFKGDFHKVAINYNELVADTSNELTLLNILRAKNGYPLHFTAISELRGNAKVSAGLKIPYTIPVSGPANVDPEVSTGIESSPAFDVAVLNGQKFQRGILQPVGPELLDFYMSQGWRQEILAALFVERIELLKGGSVIGVINNDPHCPNSRNEREERKELEVCADPNSEFRSFFKQYKLAFRKNPGTNTPLIPLEQLKSGTTLADISVLDGKKFDLGIVNGVQMVERVGSASTFFALEAPVKFKLATVFGGYSFPKSIVFDETSMSGLLPSQNGEESKLKMRIVTRSIQGAIYFLGEYLRLRNPYAVVDDDALIKVTPAPTGKRMVSAKLDGVQYGITESDNRDSRAMQVLAIIQQIVNLQKSADELPRTGTVNIVP